MSKFKRITEYTCEELDDGIAGAIDECQRVGLDFYTILKGVDSYFEKRQRKLAKEAHDGEQTARIGATPGTFGSPAKNAG